MILEAILTALLVGWALKGKFWRLADVNVKYAYMIYVPLGINIAASSLNYFRLVPYPSPVYTGAHVLGLSAWILFVCANLHLPGAKLIVGGLVINLIAILANNGMPVSYDGIIIACGKQGARHFISVFPCVKDMLIGPATRLKFLCDVVPVPRPFCMGAVYSVGDIITSIGGFIAIVAIMRSPLYSKQKVALEE